MFSQARGVRGSDHHQDLLCPDWRSVTPVLSPGTLQTLQTRGSPCKVNYTAEHWNLINVNICKLADNLIIIIPAAEGKVTPVYILGLC